MKARKEQEANSPFKYPKPIPMHKKTILYVEDDKALSFLTVDNLEQHGFHVIHQENGENVLEIFRKNDIDICLLDIMVPGIDGFTLAEMIRKEDDHVPILFLSAKSLKEDRIKGLTVGADDYLIKPYSIEELLLKIKIFLSRSLKQNTTPGIVTIGQYTFDPLNYQLTLANENHKLTQKEADLLKLFFDHKNQVLKREDILNRLWGDDDYFLGRSLDVFISKLRKVLAKDPNIRIENLHGIGFRFKLN